MADMIKFYRGLVANLPAQGDANAVYITTDEGSIYLGTGTGMKRLGDFIQVQDVASLPATGAHESALYYCVAENVLAKWDGVQWAQINKDTGMTAVEIVGEGNAITSAAYSADGRKLTLTKGATHMTAADVDGKIAAKVGEIGDKTVKTYVDEATAGIATDAALTELAGKVDANADNITALQGLVGEKAVGTQIDEKITALDLANTYDAKGSADAVKGELDAYKTSNDGVITAIKDGATIDSFKDVEDALANKQDAGDYATKTEAQGYADAKDTAIAEAKKAGDDAQSAVDALAGKVGEPTEGKTVVEMIADAQTAATYDDSEVRGLIDANADAIADEKARMDAFMAIGEGETLNAALDSLKELQDYITNEAADADIVVGKVAALEDIVAGIGGEGESATVVAYVTAAIEALKIGDYAKAADLTAAVERIAALEGKSHEHANADELALIQTGDVAKWNAAQTNAEKTASDALSAAKTELEGKITAAETAAKGHADTKAGEVQANVDALSDVVDTKAAQADLAALDGRVTAEEGKVATLQTEMDAVEAKAAKNETDIAAANTEIGKKANSADVYAKTETYTQAEVQDLMSWGSF